MITARRDLTWKWKYNIGACS